MKNKIKISALGIATMVASSLAMAPATMAWGPERETYTMQDPADHATFNSITDNPLLKDERDFVRVVEKNTGNVFTSDLEIVPGKQYEVYIYYHNDGSETYNDKAHNYASVAFDVKMISDFPKELAKGEVGKIYGEIKSSNAVPSRVWDEAYVKASQDMTLHYVEGSARIFNEWNKDGTLLSTRLFSPDGTYLGLTELNGIILGCDRYSGSVTYTIQTVAAGDPEPEPDPEPEDPTDPDPEDPEEPTTPTEKPKPVETPKELPKTGPVEIILAIVIIAAIVAGIVYWRKTRKAVKKATKKAKGRK